MPRNSNFRKVSLGLIGGAMLAGAPPAWSQQTASLSAVQQVLLPRIQPGVTLDQYRQFLDIEFFNVDADGDGRISQRDIDLHTLMEGVQLRNQAVGSAMRYDLDGDGFVTSDEIRRSMTYELRAQIGLAASSRRNPRQNIDPDFASKQIDNKIRTTLALDTDKDGKLSLAEAAASVGTGRTSGQAVRIRQFLSLDTASKGTLSLADLQSAGETLFHRIDSDKDGVVSQQELTDYRTSSERVGCEMPAASDKAKVVLLSSYETEALSSATLGSQDNVVHAGRVLVEPGSEPLYVVIASYSPTIWRFSGAVERVERVVITSSRTGPKGAEPDQRTLVGATGIMKERVSFFSKPNCLTYFSETPSSGSLQTVAAVQKGTGKAPDVVAAKYSVGGFSVPSGEIETRRGNPDATVVIEKTEGLIQVIRSARNIIVQASSSRAKDELDRFSPGGVIDIDPKTVIASQPAESYEVLPQQAGLVQLLASGALKQNSAGEYIVRQKTRFPAGLAGAHSVTFLVMKGVPYPDGDPAHSCVVMEETGEKKGAVCR